MEARAMVQTKEKERHAVSLLLVDDNPIFLRILRRFLETQGEGTLRVIGTASSGTEALTFAAKAHPHVIVLDLSMPERTGLEVLPCLRQVRPEAGIIALTLLHPDAYQAAALAAGADEFVTKYSLDMDLLPAIRRVAEIARTRTGASADQEAPALSEAR